MNGALVTLNIHLIGATSLFLITLLRFLHVCQEVTEDQLTVIANNCRRDISYWIENCRSSGRGASTTWRQDFKNTFIRLTRFPREGEKRMAWREALLTIKDQLEATEGIVTKNIEDTVGRYLHKSPEEEWVKAKAYEWLKYLERHPPTAQSWFPHLAIEVTHRAFRLNGKIMSFKRYLCHPSRRKMLSTIVRSIAHMPGL